MRLDNPNDSNGEKQANTNSHTHTHTHMETKRLVHLEQFNTWQMKHGKPPVFGEAKGDQHGWSIDLVLPCCQVIWQGKGSTIKMAKNHAAQQFLEIKDHSKFHTTMD